MKQFTPNLEEYNTPNWNTSNWNIFDIFLLSHYLNRFLSKCSALCYFDWISIRSAVKMNMEVFRREEAFPQHRYPNNSLLHDSGQSLITVWIVVHNVIVGRYSSYLLLSVRILNFFSSVKSQKVVLWDELLAHLQLLEYFNVYGIWIFTAIETLLS